MSFQARGFQARILLDSVAPSGGRLTTFEVTFPRFILAEFNTHRMLSRNAASSRAIPVKKQLDRIREEPYIPRFGHNQKGMQAAEWLTDSQQVAAATQWLKSRDLALTGAENLLALDVHKQWANRLLEPFGWVTDVATATEWSNFFGLRAHKDAQPEFQKLAYMMLDAYEKSTPRWMPEGDWHLPYVEPVDWDRALDLSLEVKMETREILRRVSVGRCGRTSTLTHDGKRDLKEDMSVHDKMLLGRHASPFEHQAEALTKAEWYTYAEGAARRWVRERIPVGNLWGWKQLRKTLASEHDFAKAGA